MHKNLMWQANLILGNFYSMKFIFTEICDNEIYVIWNWCTLIVDADRNRLSTPITTYGVPKVVLREKSENHHEKIVEWGLWVKSRKIAIWALLTRLGPSDFAGEE